MEFFDVVIFPYVAVIVIFLDILLLSRLSFVATVLLSEILVVGRVSLLLVFKSTRD